MDTGLGTPGVSPILTYTGKPMTYGQFYNGIYNGVYNGVFQGDNIGALAGRACKEGHSFVGSVADFFNDIVDGIANLNGYW
jgi:hypothetical protein